MKIIRSDVAEYFENSPLCMGYSFGDTGTDINGATISVKGRYPAENYLTNEVCQELVYVTSGTGTLLSPEGEQAFGVGDVVFVKNGEIFGWEGNFEGFFVCTPSFYPEQHKVVKL